MMTPEMGAEFAQAMEGALTDIFTILGIIFLFGIICMIAGAIVLKKGKTENNNQKRFKVVAIILWVLGGIALNLVAFFFLPAILF